jgi:hypothetical protein
MGLAFVSGILAAGALTAPASAADRVTLADPVVTATGSLGGHITERDGAPLAGWPVYLYRDGARVATEFTDINGSYSFAELSAGEYQVSFVWTGIEQFIPGAIDLAGAGLFTVVAGENTVADDSILPATSLRGRLVDTDGRPQAAFQVRAYYTAPKSAEWYSAVTDQNGEWSIADVPAGNYQVSFANPQETRIQWAYGKADRDAATLISSAPRQTATVNDTWLPETTLVVKAVDASTGASVGDFCVRTNPDDPAVCSGANGTVVLANLPAARLTFDVETPAASYYTGKRGVSATPAANQTTTVTVPLVIGGKVAVTATDRVTGQAVGDSCFRLRAIGRPDTFGSGCTDASGRATTFEPVTPGTYEIFVQGPGPYGHQWVGASGGTGDQKAAARIVVKRGRTATAPVVRLDRAGTITGVVTGSDGAPLNRAGVSYTAIDFVGWGEPERVFTDAAGRYSIDNLGPYAWPLVFGGAGYPDQWSGNVGNRFQAVKIPVTAGGSSTYDIALTRTATLRGTLTPATDQVGLAAYNAVTGDLVGTFSRYDPENGIASYEIPLIGGQHVKLRRSVYGSVTPDPAWYANARDISTATKIRIPASGAKVLNLTYN